MSQDHNHPNHATWECKYHVVFTPKYRKKVLFGKSGVTWASYSTSLHGARNGRDEEMIRAHIRNRETADKQVDQLQMKLASP